MEKRTLVFLAEGFEEVEAVTPLDYLRRAGIEVISASAGEGKTVKGAHGISLAADLLLADLERAGKLKAAFWDCALVPGGMPGASNLAACTLAGTFFKEMAAAGKIIAAICASPAVFLAPLGILKGKRFTCYPGMEKDVREGLWTAERTVADGNLVTGQGPGTAAEFALALVEKLAGETAAEDLAGAALLKA
ncbi:MAG: DJ-1/PfpI family protein [Treponema sp.]|jgi:4-methyl-5(b-hydroxyethyl)-thiazole monophosphate biosynthesis|nr:DJ-1/PfpI family protein [Treponema sp.]